MKNTALSQSGLRLRFMENDSKLTVIIPTTAEARRASCLFRAIQSIQEQGDLKKDILLIINGRLFDKDLFDSLKKRDDLKVLYLEEGNLPKAIHFGVLNVTTPFYCFLDDDDCYLPNTLQQRLQPLINNQVVDYVICNGFNYVNNVDIKRIKNFPVNQDDAASMILKENWLASCGGMYRKSTIGQECFEKMPQYLEWTYLGFLLATTRKGVFLNTPVFRIYDSPISLSKSKEYFLGMLEGLEQIIEISPDNLKRDVKTKYGKMLHDLSSYYLNDNKILVAIKFHLLSMSNPLGYNYIAYSRHIMAYMLQCAFKRAT